MPNPKKPASYHLVAGSYRRDRHRQRPADAGGIGDAPAHLAEQLQALWRELAAELPHGIGAPADRVAFELLCHLVDRSRRGELKASGVAQLVRLLDCFGMTPAARSRLDPEPPPPPTRPTTGLASFLDR